MTFNKNSLNSDETKAKRMLMMTQLVTYKRLMGAGQQELDLDLVMMEKSGVSLTLSELHN